MKAVTLKERQNLIDLAVQYYGAAAAVIDLCLDNDLELDDDLSPGTVLWLQDAYPESADPDFADYLASNGITVVSDIKRDTTAAISTNAGEAIITNRNDYLSA